MNATRRGAVGLVVCLVMQVVSSRALAQDAAEATPEVEEAPSDALEARPEPEARREVVRSEAAEDDEFGDAEDDDDDADSVRDALDAPRSRRDYYVPREEVEPAPSHVVGPLGGAAEVFVGMTPTLGLVSPTGGLAGLGGFEGGVSGGADFVFAADRQTWLGFGLAVSHYESFSFSSAQSRVRVPLIAQVYLDVPRRGQATPTLRIVPSFRWDQSYTVSTVGSSSMGGALDVGVGITWFVLDFLAIRILGDLGAGVMVTYDGADAITFAANVGANVGVVIRL